MGPSNSPKFENDETSKPEPGELLTRLEDSLLDLTKREGQCQSLDEALRLCTEAAARSLGVVRAGVWIFDDERTKITCLCVYDTETNECAWGGELFARDYPIYFGALEENRSLAADDVLTDPRTAELVEPYLDPLGVTSMLDAPIRKEGRVVGIACHEHVGRKRVWSLEEQHFAASIADLVALSIERYSRVRAERELHDREAMLDGVARTANRMFAEAEDELRYRDALLQALADSASALLADSSQKGTTRAIEILGEAARLDSITVVEDRPDADVGDTFMTERAMWRRDGAAWPQDWGLSYAKQGLLRWANSFAEGQAIVGAISSFPAHEQPFLERRSIGSVAAVPILGRDGLWGHVVFGTKTTDREWTPAEERYFRAAAASIGCALTLR